MSLSLYVLCIPKIEDVRCEVNPWIKQSKIEEDVRCKFKKSTDQTELKIVTCEFNPWIMQLNSVLTWTKDSFREHEEANRTNLLSLLLPVSLSTTVDFTMLGVAS